MSPDPKDAISLDDDDDDDHTSVAPPPEFLPQHKESPPAVGISLEDDDEDRTIIDKRPGPR